MLQSLVKTQIVIDKLTYKAHSCKETAEEEINIWSRGVSKGVVFISPVSYSDELLHE